MKGGGGKKRITLKFGCVWGLELLRGVKYPNIIEIFHKSSKGGILKYGGG